MTTKEDIITDTPDVATQTSEPSIPEQQLIRAAINLPVDKFQLGDRVFDIVDLPYDDYIYFISYLSPLIEILVTHLTSANDLRIPGIKLSPEYVTPKLLLEMCGSTMPDMVHLMCKQTDPDITVTEVKKLAKRPTVLATAILKQIQQNGIIKEFGDFFGQVTQILKPGVLKV